ncbi:hypothetical protein C2845_PM17G00050 [Panicum miliaceum]|uniref:Uncharacterized protein n=1 Tax=Panicum miliaceum TaxID=4540 RepID=A0A3L6Q1S2_PANMI|nr:hypothetical protein C2845_PM17G00050 [Panicum miliaceum]
MSFLASGRCHLLRELSGRRTSRPEQQGAHAAFFRRYSAHHLSLDGVEDAAEQAVEPPPSPSMSLAKNLASLAEESAEAIQRQRKPLTRMKYKRLVELRMKKRVKAQNLNDKFYDLLGKVAANVDTLEDAYDIARLNSNIDLACAKDDWARVSLSPRFISDEIGVPDWCFTVPLHKEVDSNVNSKLIYLIQEKIEDTQLVAFMQKMFDAKVTNLVFGGYTKGHGLPQGVLAPILMNIYLDSFDHAVFRICLKHEGLGSEARNVSEDHGSNLRRWFRSQLKGKDENSEDQHIVRLR